MKKRPLLSIFLRYLILVLVALPNLYLFYLIFTPLTVYVVYFLLSLFYSDIVTYGSTIVLNVLKIEIIEACVAGSAYYLLLILNLAIPEIKIRKRVQMILFSFVTLFIVNVLRIFFLAIMANNGSPYFDAAHKFFWYFLSTIFVVGIWFFEVWMFKIKQIPFWDDMKLLYKNSLFSKK